MPCTTPATGREPLLPSKFARVVKVSAGGATSAASVRSLGVCCAVRAQMLIRKLRKPRTKALFTQEILQWQRWFSTELTWGRKGQHEKKEGCGSRTCKP